MSKWALYFFACLLLVANAVLPADVRASVPDPPTHIKVSLHVLGTPRLGEQITIAYTATPDIDIAKMRLHFRCSSGSQLVSGSGVIYTSAKKRETKAYSVRIRLISAPARVVVKAQICDKNHRGEEVFCPSGHASIGWHLIDEKTGLLGGLDELKASANRGQEFELEGGCIDVYLTNPQTLSNAEPEESGYETDSERQEDSEQPRKPRLVWEKEFERDVLAVGVDEERFDLEKQNIMSCLKWIQFEGGEFRPFDVESVNVGRSLGHGCEGSASRNMRYFVVHEPNAPPANEDSGFHYALLDWNGKRIWEKDGGTSQHEPLFRALDNGNSVFFERSPVGDCDWLIHRARFYGPTGEVNADYRFKPLVSWVDFSSASNGSFCVLTTGAGVFVFGRTGKAVWDRYEDQALEPHGSLSRSAVTDSGEVMVVQKSAMIIDCNIGIYDAEGESKATWVFDSVACVAPLDVDGRGVFVSLSRPGPSSLSRIFRYDFSNNTGRTIVEEPQCCFSGIDVDGGSKLVGALAVSERGRDVRILLYDYSGKRKGEVELPEGKYSVDYCNRISVPWSKLLGNALLVAEGKKLKLYALDSSGD